MRTQAVLAEQSVSVTELRKNPSRFFKDEPIAVLSNNKTAGYMVNAELFEYMIKIIEKYSPVKSLFRPSAERLKAISLVGEKLLLEKSADELSDFEE